MTASQAPVSLQEMLAWLETERAEEGLAEPDWRIVKAILALLQSIAAPDEALIQKLREAVREELGFGLHPNVFRAVLSALSGGR